MKKLLLKLPISYDSCKTCPFFKRQVVCSLRTLSNGVSDRCRLFECKIINYERCAACYSCEVDDDE